MSGKPLRTSMLCKHHWILLVFTIPKLFFFFYLDQYWESYEFFNILLFSGNCRKTLTKIDFPCKVLPNVFYRHFQVFQNCRKMPEDARRCRKTCLVIPRHLTAILRRDCHPSPLLLSLAVTAGYSHRHRHQQRQSKSFLLTTTADASLILRCRWVRRCLLSILLHY